MERFNGYSIEDVADDYNLWAELVDPDAAYSEDDFNALRFNERVAILENLIRVYADESGFDHNEV